jgi:DNA-directed RNA polymerase specialized sigma24 family protein
VELAVLYRATTLFVGRLTEAYHLRCEQTEAVRQSVWLEVLRHRLCFRGESAVTRLRCWLPAVVWSKVADLLRRANRQPRQDPGAGEWGPAAPEEGDPAVRLAKERERGSVRAALGRLRAEETPRNGRLLEGWYLGGRSVNELAAAEVLTANEVSCRLRRMLAKLRTRLIPEAEG